MANPEAILVAGGGSWGTALAILLARNQQQTILWIRDSSQLAQMQRERQNQRYLPGIVFPESLNLSGDLPNGVQQASIILLAIPSSAFREILLQIAPHIPEDSGICWATKGLEPQSGLLLHQVAQRILGDSRRLAMISGPTFAGEVAKGLPTAVTVASTDLSYAEVIADKLRNPWFRPYTNSDLVGVQIGAAAKNVIAIAAGIADGLGFGANTRAALVTRGLAEIIRLGIAMGGKQETFMGLAGLGDLMLTCTDNQSRNRRFGYALGQGQTATQAQLAIGQVVEGWIAVGKVVELARSLAIEMPISEQVERVTQGHCAPEEAVSTLLSRKLKTE